MKEKKLLTETDKFLAKYLISLSVCWKNIIKEDTTNSDFGRGMKAGLNFAADSLVARANDILNDDERQTQDNGEG